MVGCGVRDRQHAGVVLARIAAEGQRRITHRCACGRLIRGNAAWWSHTHTPDGQPRDGHRFNGTT